MTGHVSLVGAGPGDPELITVRGLRLLASCEVLVHDRLVAAELIRHAPPDALVVNRSNLRQEAVTRLLLRLARTGKRVVRLKGGDPFVFGRGGEEALALVAAGIPVEVVPGVSSLSAVPGSAGIPITHRGIATQVTLVTASGRDGHPPYDAAQLAAAPGTLVVFMGGAGAARLAAELIAHGRSPETPAAVISHGTLETQQVVTSPLHELAHCAPGLPTPALVVVGDVVGLRPYLRELATGLPTGNSRVTSAKRPAGRMVA